jgi:hypothetical protein
MPSLEYNIITTQGGRNMQRDDVETRIEEVMEELKTVEPWSIEEKQLIDELFELEEVMWHRRTGQV